MRYAQVGNDPELEALYFDFGRYLLISSSRSGGILANLQGIWNSMTRRPPWSSNYMTNINAEMNYWAAELDNLSDLHTTLTNWIVNAAKTGRETNKNFYGMSGWPWHNQNVCLPKAKIRIISLMYLKINTKPTHPKTTVWSMT